MISFRVTSRPIFGITPVEETLLRENRRAFDRRYRDNVAATKICIPRGNTSTVHLDRSLRNNECFHRPATIRCDLSRSTSPSSSHLARQVDSSRVVIVERNQSTGAEINGFRGDRFREIVLEQRERENRTSSLAELTAFQMEICRSNCLPKPVDNSRLVSPRKTTFEVFGPR